MDGITSVIVQQNASFSEDVSLTSRSADVSTVIPSDKKGDNSLPAAQKEY